MFSRKRFAYGIFAILIAIVAIVPFGGCNTETTEPPAGAKDASTDPPTVDLGSPDGETGEKGKEKEKTADPE